ncbi:4-hydroxyphenylpyruvate dioxygenase [Pyrus ussuriensis x Pyrus communis]|uniref:4-hydroxyphenylpyruvate dioxygenase n=1 Tax=Pyrus ussuriensis x Pyrus communis TaxID=2448454 RepID=A0A5N5EZ24_9ROSA|nr:4-hydroxyphenylpyruvate dioxygenase [Pyrus ussuriensis x Pyrus communis]KAB2598088.1 4-hydroxyphenylpyruvate dioxygenase [Pyrus ussuriensis x Pyrus communis]
MVCLKLQKEIGKFGKANICCDISDSGDEEKEEEEKKEKAREAEWSTLGIEVVWSKLGITFALGWVLGCRWCPITTRRSRTTR